MEPLAHALRPKNLNEFIGQTHLVGQGKPLRIAIEQGTLFSFILWGPPGVGKTTLARIYAEHVGATFYELSAVAAGKADVAKIIDSDNGGKRKILFLDEIHRFNKAQQDFLLPFVENGTLILIGATTENPSFEINKALLSRCRVFVLEPHQDDDMGSIIKKVLPSISVDALSWLVSLAAGDARQALSVLSATVSLYEKVSVDTLRETVQSAHIQYDKKGEDHYNVISALIKSMRASQGDAALYYLARLVEAGEDPLFIARRLVIFASEDIGLAQPTALVVANAAFDACKVIGYPECSINLAHAVAYLSGAKKDRSAYEAFSAARADVRSFGALPVPLVIRNGTTQLMKNEGYGEGYQMYTDKTFLPKKLLGRKYLKPD